MSITSTVACIGIGYIVKDRLDKKTTNSRPSYSVYPNRQNSHPSIKDYLSGVIVDKLNNLFYGNTIKTKKNKQTVYEHPYHSQRADYYIPSRYREEIDDPHFSTHKEANDFVNKIRTSIERYGHYSFFDYLEDTNRKDKKYTDMQYGWEDIKQFEGSIWREYDDETCEEFWTVEMPHANCLRKY